MTSRTNWTCPRLGVLAACALLAATAALGVCCRRSRDGAPSSGAPEPAIAASAYVGSGVCSECHASEAAGWGGSQHAAAMAAATDATALGRFDGSRFTYAGVTSTFFRRDGKFLARTDGPDGRLADFEIKYTFGVFPLQQYLVELPGGRLQALSIAWDTRPRAAGGQRWLHLYPNEAIKAGDPLHWTGLQQNWNFMCADCHSTNVRKGYDSAARRFATTWSEISVGCEACHGPASAHVGWARSGTAGTRGATDVRLTASLNERRRVTWTIDPATSAPVRSVARETDREIEVCARCHARRGQLTDAIKAGDPFEDGFRASLLDPALFHPDGQVRGEVYNYASFLQSRMYAKGVTCSDCHDPHTGRLRLPGNAVCTQCHPARKFDAPAHHFHRAGTPAAACTTCHLPASTFMQVDVRHDHSFRVPRPDRTATLAVPNACTSACHRQKTAAWAAAEIERRSGGRAAGYQLFAEAFQAAEAGAPGAADALIRLVRDPRAPAIVRASAIERLEAAGGPLDSTLATDTLRDPSPLVRRAVVAALQAADADARLRLIPPLLSDPIRTVRVQAALALADFDASRLPASFARALDEFLSEQRFNADRPEAQVNLGMMLARRGQPDQAIGAFREAIALDPTFVPAYVNASDVYRSQQNEAAGERILREALARNPAAADAHHALGLSLVRQKRTRDALAELAAAVRLAPRAARYAYVYGVALHDTGSTTDALRVLERSLAAHPFERETLSALATFSEEARQLKDARAYASRLLALDPDNQEVRALVSRLR